MQFLLSLIPLTLLLLIPASCNPLQPNDLRVNVYPFDRRNPFMTNRIDPVRREASPEPAPQGVYDIIAPEGGIPAGCTNTVPYSFGITTHDGAPPARGAPLGEICEHQIGMTMKLNSGILLDGQGRIGSIVANRQFQFDGPPAQHGAIYTGGWSVCDDNTLALGPSKQFYKCLSGDFYNLYDQAIGGQCVPTTIMVVKLRGC